MYIYTYIYIYIFIRRDADYKRYLQSKSLSRRWRLFAFNISDLLMFVGFSKSLVYKFCTKSCRTTMSFVRIGTVTAMLHLRAQLKFYPTFFKCVCRFRKPVYKSLSTQWAHSFLTFAPDGRELSISRPCCFTPRKEPHYSTYEMTKINSVATNFV